MPLIDEEVLKLDLAVDASGAVQGLRKVDAAFSRSMRDIQSQTERLNKLNKTYFGGAIAGWQKYRKEAKTVADLPAKLTKQMQDNIDAIKQERAEMKDKGTEAAKQHKDRIQQLLKENAEIRRTKKQIADMGQETINITLKEAGDELQESLESAAEPLTALFNKDVPRAFGAGGKMFGRLVEKTFLGLGKTSGKFGQSLKELGGKMMSGGEGGVGGKAMGMGGKAMGGLGAALGKMGPMLETLSTLGPILQVTAGALVAVVKLLIDAESQAKEFQKNLLATASTGEFLAKTGHNANWAYDELKTTVTDLRKSAYHFKTNLDWGIQAKDHEAFRNVLTQEGVSISRMADEFKLAKERGEATAGAVKFYAEQTATAVAFSRQFGLQLNEIGQFQSNLMTDMGMSLDRVNKHFALMAQSASESGMAMNKFFAIMRGVSTDLSLYNMRMDAAVRLLGRLGKAMSPQTAQKFMSTLAQGFKNMGRLEKLRMTLLAGEGKTRKIVEKDIAQKKVALAEEMGDRIKGGKKQASMLLDAYMKGGKGAGLKLTKALEGVEGGGALRERASRVKFMQKMAGKGTFGLAQSIGDLGIEGTIEMQKAALGRFAKPGASLVDMMGELGPEMMAENMGISQEQLTQMAMMEEAINETREDLIAQAQGDQERIAEINKMSGDELLKQSGMDAKELLSTEKDFAKQQTELTSSLLDKLQTLIDFLMNQLYDIMLSIWETMMDMDVFGGEENRRKKLEIAAAKTRDPAIMALLKKGGGSEEGFKKALNESEQAKAVKESLAYLQESVESSKRLEQIDAELSDDAKEKRRADVGVQYASEYEARLNAEKKRILEAQKKAAPASQAFEQLNTELRSRGEDYMEGALGSAFQKAGVSTKGQRGRAGRSGQNIATMMTLRDMTLEEAMKDRGLTSDQMQRVLENLPVDLRAAMLGQGQQKGVEEVKVKKPEEKPSETGQRAGAVPGKPAVETQPDVGGENLAQKYFGSGEGMSSAAAKPPPAPEAVEEGTELAAEQLGVSDGQFNTMQDIDSALRRTGIRMDKGYYKNNIGPIIEDATYAAMQKALYEYWLYSADPADVEKKLAWATEKGIDLNDPKAFAKGAAEEWSKKGASPFGPGVGGGTPGGGVQLDENGNPIGSTLEPNAAGGLVTGIKGGMAVVSPARGEGLTSIGRGEQIVPAGGGRSSLAVSVDVTGAMGGDFNRYLERVIQNAIYDYEAKKRTV